MLFEGIGVIFIVLILNYLLIHIQLIEKNVAFELFAYSHIINHTGMKPEVLQAIFLILYGSANRHAAFIYLILYAGIHPVVLDEIHLVL